MYEKMSSTIAQVSRPPTPHGSIHQLHIGISHQTLQRRKRVHCNTRRCMYHHSPSCLMRLFRRDQKRHIRLVHPTDRRAIQSRAQSTRPRVIGLVDGGPDAAIAGQCPGCDGGHARPCAADGTGRLAEEAGVHAFLGNALAFGGPRLKSGVGEVFDKELVGAGARFGHEEVDAAEGECGIGYARVRRGFLGDVSQGTAVACVIPMHAGVGPVGHGQLIRLVVLEVGQPHEILLGRGGRQSENGRVRVDAAADGFAEEERMLGGRPVEMEAGKCIKGGRAIRLEDGTQAKVVLGRDAIKEIVCNTRAW